MKRRRTVRERDREKARRECRQRQRQRAERESVSQNQDSRSKTEAARYILTLSLLLLLATVTATATKQGDKDPDCRRISQPERQRVKGRRLAAAYSRDETQSLCLSCSAAHLQVRLTHREIEFYFKGNNCTMLLILFNFLALSALVMIL